MKFYAWIQNKEKSIKEDQSLKKIVNDCGVEEYGFVSKVLAKERQRKKQELCI